MASERTPIRDPATVIPMLRLSEEDVLRAAADRIKNRLADEIEAGHIAVGDVARTAHLSMVLAAEAIYAATETAAADRQDQASIRRERELSLFREIAAMGLLFGAPLAVAAAIIVVATR